MAEPDLTQYPALPPEPTGSWLAQNRKSVILGSIVLVLAGAIGATALIRRQPSRSSANTVVTNQTTTAAVNTGTASTATPRPTFRRYQAPVIVDTDHDGLTDDEETTAGTNPNKVDTDGDGLTDYDEVKVYHTNPLKTDTDGDGVLDGPEVKAGTNPNGPGQLRDLPQAIKQLNTNS